MKRKKSLEQELYGIIGLGRFGTSLAQKLAEYGAEVVVVDQNETRVREMRQFTDNAFVTDDLSRENLREMGFANCTCVAICIGDKLDTSILTALNVVGLGVPRVIAKAVSAEHGLVLEKLGVEVVYPERDMAVRLAKRLTTKSVMEYISLSNAIEISELSAGPALAGKSVVELDLRARFGLNIIAVEHNKETMISVRPDFVFEEGDVLIVIGRAEDIQRFEGTLE